jgi:hypothetical protein
LRTQSPPGGATTTAATTGPRSARPRRTAADITYVHGYPSARRESAGGGPLRGYMGGGGHGGMLDLGGLTHDDLDLESPLHVLGDVALSTREQEAAEEQAAAAAAAAVAAAALVGASGAAGVGGVVGAAANDANGGIGAGVSTAGSQQQAEQQQQQVSQVALQLPPPAGGTARSGSGRLGGGGGMKRERERPAFIQVRFGAVGGCIVGRIVGMIVLS